MKKRDDVAPKHYQWTPGRIAVGVVIVLAAGSFIGFVGQRELRNLQEGLAADTHYAELLDQVTNEQIAEFNLDNLDIARQDIEFGGPPKDGIPALSHPETVGIAEAGHLLDDERVIGVVVGGEARAYPIRALMYHEAVNDELAGIPFAVVYCPLCDSVSVVDRRLEGTVREFGISGLVVNSNVLLYDRGDDSLWSQLGFRAISGPNVGKSLAHLPWELSTVAAWRDAHPDATVMTFNTGYKRNYAKTPYGDYFASDSLLFPVASEDARLKRRDRVVGVQIGDAVRAYPIELIREAGTIRDSVAGQPIVLTAENGALRVVEAPAESRVVHTFWFAWAAFHPQSEIYGQ